MRESGLDRACCQRLCPLVACSMTLPSGMFSPGDAQALSGPEPRGKEVVCGAAKPPHTTPPGCLAFPSIEPGTGLQGGKKFEGEAASPPYPRILFPFLGPAPDEVFALKATHLSDNAMAPPFGGYANMGEVQKPTAKSQSPEAPRGGNVIDRSTPLPRGAR